VVDNSRREGLRFPRLKSNLHEVAPTREVKLACSWVDVVSITSVCSVSGGADKSTREKGTASSAGQNCCQPSSDLVNTSAGHRDALIIVAALAVTGWDESWCTKSKKA